MATAKYTRVDNGRKSPSSYWSSITIFVFVALCLVGLWMIASSSIVPVQNGDEGAVEKKQDVGEKEEAQGSVKNNGTTSSQESEASSEKNGTAQEVENLSNEGSYKSDDGSKTGMQDEDKKLSGGDSKGKAGAEENSNEKTSELVGGDYKPNASEKVSGNNETKVGDSSGESNGGKVSDQVVEDGDNELGKASLGSKGDNSTNSQTSEVDPGESEYSGKGNSVSKEDDSTKSQTSEVDSSVVQAALLNETAAQNESFPTQAAESKNEKEGKSTLNQQAVYDWKLCDTVAGPDFIPCLDNLKALKRLRSTKHYEHRERHCPEESPTCLVPLPEGYRRSIKWPQSLERIWFYNVPHTKLVEFKGHQNWLKVSGEYLTFPGGGTQFKRGAIQYIKFIEESVREITWGKRTRVALDVGCGVASFGGFLFNEDVLTMSLAPKDEHEAQVQFALERGIPAISAVMGTKRLPFPAGVYDVIHCARCRVPWHIDGGKLLLELNRVLRPGGFFLWSATPVYQNQGEDVKIWTAMEKLMKGMCWELVNRTKATFERKGVAIFRKPTSDECFRKRTEQIPPFCPESDDANAAWNVSIQACVHEVPTNATERGSQWPEMWPERLEKAPYWLLRSEVGVYGKAAPEDFVADYHLWKRMVHKTYLSGLGIDWSFVRNVMDMKAAYGGFAAALRDLGLWVMNVVTTDSPDTLPIVYDRGLFGIYHDWCETFSTYPRTYDLLHADHLFSNVKDSERCKLVSVVAEVDRILRPEGTVIVRDNVETVTEVETMLRSMQWEVLESFSMNGSGLLSVKKSMWRPSDAETLPYAVQQTLMSSPHGH